jgi:hypothetical protein
VRESELSESDSEREYPGVPRLRAWVTACLTRPPGDNDVPSLGDVEKVRRVEELRPRRHGVLLEEHPLDDLVRVRKLSHHDLWEYEGGRGEYEREG